MNSIQFLQTFHPLGPWVLTAIALDRKSVTTITFGPSTIADAEEWIAKHNGKANLYFNVNLVGRPVTKKVTREDIVSVPWLHVDVDARVGEPLADEIVRIKKLLLDECPVQAPTCVVFSGGGCQAFWRLKRSLPIKTLADAENAGRYSQQLEIILGGDACHNVDRIMRLPGTMNIPDAKKIAKGRVPAQAEVLVYRPENVYPIDDFVQAPAVQMPGANLGYVEVPTNVPRLGNVNELDKWKVPDRVKVVIVQGHDPDAPKEGDNSRSAWLFDVCCQLLRAQVPDDIVFAVVTDPDFGISASVLDKGTNAARYALRQIERAKEEVEEPWLRRLNEQFAVIGNLGGKCRIIEEIVDPAMNRSILTRQTFGDFRNRYANETLLVGKRHLQVGDWWIRHPRRRQYDTIVFSPGRVVPSAYNLWQGFACEAKPGAAHELYLQHVRENICAGNPLHYDYLVGWMARAVQVPDSPGETAIVLRGKSGTGKSFFAKQFGAIWGKHFLQVSDAKHLVGSFNAHLRDCVVLFGDEAFFAGDRRHESVLKTLITEEKMIVEHKGVDAEVSPNFIHLILASNADWVVPTGATERRFFMLDVADGHRQDTTYFHAINEAMRHGGRQNLLYFLLNFDLKAFDSRRVPMTLALLEQKIHSLGPMHEWWLDRLMEGSLLNGQQWKSLVYCDELVDDYVQACARYSVPRRGSSVKLGLFLSSVCPEGWPKRARHSETGRKHYYQFPPLRELRDKWDSIFGAGIRWSEEVPTEEERSPF